MCIYILSITAMGFVDNYVPCGLSPQTYGMHVIIKGTDEGFFISAKAITSCQIPLLSVYRNDLFFVVRAACLAYSVGNHKSSAFAAFYKCRRAHLPVSSSGISSSLRRFIFWANRHLLTPPIYINIFIIFSSHTPWVYTSGRCLSIKLFTCMVRFVSLKPGALEFC